MKIPIFNIYIMRQSTLERIIKDSAVKAYSFSKDQINVLMKDNDRLAQGLKPKKKKMILRRRNNGQ